MVLITFCGGLGCLVKIGIWSLEAIQGVATMSYADIRFTTMGHLQVTRPPPANVLVEGVPAVGRLQDPGHAGVKFTAAGLNLEFCWLSCIAIGWEK